MCSRPIQGALLFLLGLVLLPVNPVQAQPQPQPLQVVATTPSLGVLAREVGGDLVEVRVLAPADRDPHYLDARPSFMALLRRADLLLEVGAGLEEGWLPAAVSGAANPVINTGRPGRFRAVDHLGLRPSITVEGPNVGHVHAEGNPHFNLDPLRMSELSLALGERLGALRPEHAGVLQARSEQVSAGLRAHAAALAARIEPGQGFVAYHEDLDYLRDWLPVKGLGYLEPVPGVPPTARHLRALVERLQGHEGRVLHAAYQPGRGGAFLHRHLGWPVHVLSLEPPVDGGLDDYLRLMESWVAPFE
ncbi:metal ABC transporter substrate-binding protein [Thioalkalivibrio sulfidiphilus]|uniref:metal ABC transporter substrate-binding protein n=1 Tax=Thioalkalivibrio sulfidiphilus TaxID=1033854 RepID=UPI003B38C61C